MKTLILSLVLILLESCATQPSTKMDTVMDSNSNNGIIVGTISFKNEKPIFNGYSFYYLGENDSKINATNRIYIAPEQIVKMKFNPNFFDNEKAVYFFSINRPAGKYKFVNLGLFANGGMIQSTSFMPMNIGFTIEKGKVNYIGEIYVDYRNQQILLNDQKERDLPKLKGQFPDLNIK